MNITFLGQGAMGSRMADRLEGSGFGVTRWNRTGATQSPREAVVGARVVIAMLRDDEASRSVWLDRDTGALAGLGEGALIIESSTLTVDWVCTLARQLESNGHGFLDAPVLGSRPQAEAGQLIHLVGGDASLLDRVRPILAAMGAAQLHVGQVGAGAALKLIANALFAIQVGAIAELIGRMPSLNLDPAAATELLGNTPLFSPAAKAAASLMLTDAQDPMFPVHLVAKDLGYVIGEEGEKMPMSSAAHKVFEQAIDAGLASANLTAVSSLYKG